MSNKLGTIQFSPNGKMGFIHIQVPCELDGGACKECNGDPGINLTLPEKWNDRCLEGRIVYVDKDGVLQIMDGDPND
jgi:hypothetical protein